eukprot:s452_g14.t1
MQREVETVIRSAARDYTRSVARGLGPSNLKDSFDVSLLADIPVEHMIVPFNMQSASHGRDVMLVASWFMLRELELASCKWSHMYIENSVTNVMLPVQKNDTVGSLTLRSLRCACRIRIHPLCPVHAARRHLDRIQAHSEFRFQADFPIVPNEEGHVTSKHYMVQFFRRTISAAGVALSRPNAEGQETERFSGHVCRVSGAQWLSRLGMPLNQIQLLGRWSSTAVERYVQLAPLAQIEHSGAALLHPQREATHHINRDDIRTTEHEGGVRAPQQAVAIDVESLEKAVTVDEEPGDTGDAPSVSRADLDALREQLSSLRQAGFRGCHKCFRDQGDHLASESVVQPLLDGYQKGTTKISVEEDEKPIVQAVLEHMWQEATVQWQLRLAAAPVEKAPKSLPAQIWQKQIARYNGVTIEGRPRRFPEREVLGAEQILGRIWFEHTSSKCYTPVGLGELLERRSFTASGDVNPLQKQQKSGQALRLVDDQLVHDEEGRPWTPRSVLAVMDGINSIRWAWVLLQVGEEDHVHTYADWFIQKVRGRAHKLENMRAFWDAAGWRIAMGMRSGQSFGEVSTEVMSDVDLLNECMSREMPKESKTEVSKKRAAQTEANTSENKQQKGAWQYGNNTKGAKGTNKGRSQSFAQYNSSQKWRQSGWNQQSTYESHGAGDQNHGAECVLLVTAGTPCPDFSVVAGKSEGRNLPEGSKFSEFIDRVETLEKELPYHRVMVVAENVIMNDPSDAKFISDRLKTEPIVIDAADASLVSRPRLWWIRIGWQDVKVHPLTGNRLKWSQHNGYRKVMIDLPLQEASGLSLGGLQLHEDVVNRKRPIPCFTTPSPDPAGRPPPKRHKLKTTEAARQRWLEDSRQFAPWQYADHAMLRRGEEAVVIPPGVKEELHGLPRDWSRLPDIHNRARHRMLANSWHMYAAIMAIAFVMQFTPAAAVTVPPQVHRSTIQRVLDMGNPLMARPGPGAWHQSGWAMKPCKDMWEHWEESHRLEHPALAKPPMDPGMEATFEVTDERYAHPISQEEFHKLSRAYVDDRLQNSKPSKHWEVMLQELIDDKEKGRVEGPLQAPADWGITLAAHGDMHLSPAPTTQAWAALCFAVEQSDKVRRCEDYRRSSHNSTVQADDCPHYEDVTRYVTTMRYLQTLGKGMPLIWGHDLTGAYRQIPLEPSDSPTRYLKGHRCGGTEQHRSEQRPVFLVALVGHFVDDFTGVELETTAESSSFSFKTVFQKLGLSMNPEKEQAPSTKQKVLGVVIHAYPERLVIETCPKRKEKLLALLESILQSNRLSAEEAQRVAGKLGFMATTLFGGIGMAAIQPFYARAHHLGEQRNEKLTFALRAAIHTMKQLLVEGKPRTFPWFPKDPTTHAVIYSDAYFLVGDTMMKPKDVPELWSPKKRRAKANGWGFVTKFADKVVFAHGELPQEFIDKFVSRRAFIYMMEIMAAFIAVTFLQAELPPFFIMFIDNQAGKTALQKGYGSDERVNAIITAFWVLTAEKEWSPAFQYVKSELNISDPISRHDVAIAQKEGWEERPIDLTRLLEVLEEFARDPDGSIANLLQSLLEIQRTPSGVGMMHGVESALRPAPSTHEIGAQVRYSQHGFGVVMSAFTMFDEYFLKDLGNDQAIWAGEPGGELKRYSAAELTPVSQELFDLRFAIAQNLAAVSLKLERYKEAIDWANAALCMDGKAPKALMRLGLGLLRTGKPGPASDWLAAAQKAMPNDAEVRKLLREAELKRSPTWICANGCCGPWGIVCGGPVIETMAEAWSFVHRVLLHPRLSVPLTRRLQSAAPAGARGPANSVAAQDGVVEIGDTVTATVLSFNDMWVELTVDGSKGRMHKAEPWPHVVAAKAWTLKYDNVSWSRAFHPCGAGPQDLSQVEVKHPEEVLRKGEKVRCFVKQFRKDFMALSMLDCAGHDTFKNRLRVSQLEKGHTYDAKVVHVNPRIGAFVDLGAVANGLIPLKMLGRIGCHVFPEKAEALRLGSPPGREMQVRVVDVDVAKGQITVAPAKPT